MPTSPHIDIDLVIAFRATRKYSVSKKQTREDARKAEQQYKRLIETLTYAGLKAVGRRGESLGHLLVFVTCPLEHVEELVRRERHSDFISGLPVAASVIVLSPADRIRLVHAYISSTPADGGLGISSESPEWDLIESIFPLHNREFNDHWIRAWTPRHMASVELEGIRDQFGDAVAFYYAFLSSYTSFLVAPAIFGLVAHFFLPPYSPIYSILLSIWSIVFVEWWRIHERILSMHFGTRGSARVEKHRPQFKKGIAWWLRELRVLASVPVIILFAGILSALLTGIFVLEAFVTHLYQGPGRQLISFSPTLLFVALVPRVLAIYQAIAVRLTNWENHAHKSSYSASLTLKTFALSGIVAYMGLGLSAFVYVPFGEGVMRWVQTWLSRGAMSQGFASTIGHMLNRTTSRPASDTSGPSIWEANPNRATAKLDSGRLRDQMFAYVVADQVMNNIREVGLPFIFRRVDSFRKDRAARSKTTSTSSATSSASSSDTALDVNLKKRVVFEDEKERGGLVERAFLDRVRKQAALPEYDLFVDYSEMIIQFGYVVLWSAIWPFAGVMAFLNNLLEMRSDAFKLTVHKKRPIPLRTDTIGPWLDALTFLTWLGALTNSALLYLFSPQMSTLSSSLSPTNSEFNITTVLDEKVTLELLSSKLPFGANHPATSSTALSASKDLLLKAVLVSLAASHGFILIRLLIKHIVEKVFWRGSGEVEERERLDREVKLQFLKGLKLSGEVRVEEEVHSGEGPEVKVDDLEFWDHDEGLEEIGRISKEI